MTHADYLHTTRLGAVATQQALTPSGGEVNNTSLDFTNELQSQDNWCWAAVAHNVSVFYTVSSPWSQCKIVCAALPRTDCCTAPGSDSCNVIGYLNKSLAVTTNFKNIQEGSLSFDQVVQELTNKRVVGIRIGWVGGGGHFAVIHGAGTGPDGNFYNIADPWYEENTWQEGTLYQNAGTWTHTYFTLKPVTMLNFAEVPENIAAKISDFRPVLQVSKKPAEKLPDDYTLSVPHEVYNLGLDQLNNDNAPEPQLSGLRVVEHHAGNYQALYELNADQASQGVRQAYHHPAFLDGYQHALQQVMAFTAKETRPCELRTLQIHGLKTEAFWIHYKDDAGSDQFYPFRSTGTIKSGQFYTRDDFYKLVSLEAASKDTTDPLAGG